MSAARLVLLGARLALLAAASFAAAFLAVRALPLLLLFAAPAVAVYVLRRRPRRVRRAPVARAWYPVAVPCPAPCPPAPPVPSPRRAVALNRAADTRARRNGWLPPARARTVAIEVSPECLGGEACVTCPGVGCACPCGHDSRVIVAMNTARAAAAEEVPF